MKKKKDQHSVLARFLLHLHPRMIDKQALVFSRTFGLGGVNALLFFILAVTGLLLRFNYVPTPEQAYDSILALQEESVLGGFIRNIHHWSAMLMVVTAFLHLLRVFYSQSIYYERKKTWYYGLLLFVIVLAFNFTGYLLPWDQLSYWAVTIMTNIIAYIPIIGEGLAYTVRGGDVVNGNTLLNFYNLHTALLPLLFVFFVVLHFWLIRKAKGVTVTPKEHKEMVSVNPELISREIIMALSLIAGILLMALFFDAPLLEKAHPLISPNPSKAPWYFMGIQELLIHVHPLVATLIIPTILVIFFSYIPQLQIDKDRVGVWFYSKKGKKIILLTLVFTVLLTLLLIIIFAYFLDISKLDFPLWISTGLIPLLLYLIPFLGFMLYLRLGMKANRVELVLAAATLIFTSYLVMMIVGICFRGAGMLLIF